MSRPCRALQAGDDLALNEIMGRWKQPLASYLIAAIWETTRTPWI
jgi:hypothetical protein